MRHGMYGGEHACLPRGAQHLHPACLARSSGYRFHQPDQKSRAADTAAGSLKSKARNYASGRHGLPTVPKSVDDGWTMMKNRVQKGNPLNSQVIVFLRKTGAGEGIRTLDPNLGKTKQAITPL